MATKKSMKTAVKAAMLVIGILFLAVTLYAYEQLTAAVRLTEAQQLSRAVGAAVRLTDAQQLSRSIGGAGSFVGSAALAGLCFVAYAILRLERRDDE